MYTVILNGAGVPVGREYGMFLVKSNSGPCSDWEYRVLVLDDNSDRVWTLATKLAESQRYSVHARLKMQDGSADGLYINAADVRGMPLADLYNAQTWSAQIVAACHRECEAFRAVQERAATEPPASSESITPPGHRPIPPGPALA